MESDLSLIEIASEDDSLLQQIPNDDVLNLNPNHHNNDYFSCSPFHGKSQRIEDTVKNEDTEKGTCTSSSDSVNKENFSATKAEGPKLGIDRHQMKRKKGGYNLRKSLAWDRAFFTEEGVLNSEELSLISGSLSNSNGEALSVIHEEGSCSPYLQAIEENLFKELPATTLNKGENSPSSKHAPPLSPAMVARRKVLPVQDVSRSGSKRSGCPRPVASSSLKRPATLNETKAAKNATVGATERVSKLSALKPEPNAASKTVKNATSNATDPKQNQITHPGTHQSVSSKRKAGLKVSSSNMKNVVNKAKPGPAGKSLTTKTSDVQSKRNLGGSDKCFPTSSHFPSMIEINRSSSVIRNPSLPSTVNASSYHDERSRKTVTLSQNACTSGMSMKHVQLRPAKPSGLRMPSPSLGFFSQPKASPSQSSSKSSQPLCESNIPSLSKSSSLRPVQHLRPPLAPGRIKKAVNDKETPGKIKLSGSNSGVSISSSVNTAFNEKVNEVSELTYMQKDPIHHNGYGSIKNQQKLHPNDFDMNQQLLELREEPCMTETNSQMDEKGMQSDHKSFLLSPEKTDKYDMHKKIAEVSSKDINMGELENPHLAFYSSSEMKLTACLGKNYVIDQQLLQCKPSNQSSKEFGVILDNNAADLFSNVIQVTSKVHDDSLSEIKSVGKQFLEQAELHPTREIDLISGEGQMLVKKVDLMKNFVCPEERNNCICEVVAETTPKILDCNETETEKPHIVYNLENQENYNPTKIDGIRINTIVEDATEQSLDCNSKVESRSSNSSFSVDNRHLIIVDNVNEGAEKIEGLGSSLVRQEVLQDYLLNGNSFFPEKQEQNNVLQCVESPEHKRTVDCGSELKSLATPCRVLVAMPECESKFGGCQYMEDSPAVAVVCEPVLENSNLNTQGQPCTEKQCEATFLKLEIMEEDQVTSAICAKNLLVTCPKSGRCCESGLETSSSASDQILDKQVEIYMDVRNPIELEDVENKELNLSVEHSFSNCTSHPEVDDGLCHENISMEQILMAGVQLNVNEQCELRMSYSSGNEKVSNKEKQSPRAIENIQSLEKFENLSNENSADLHSEDAGLCTLEDFRGLSSHRYSCGAFQKVDTNNEPLLDGFMQFTSDSFVDCAIGNVLSNQYVVVHDDTNQKCGYPNNQNQDKRTEEVSMDLDPSFYSEKLEKNVNVSDFIQDKKTEEVFMDHDLNFCMNDTLPIEELEKNVNGSDQNQDKRTEEVSMDHDPSFCMNDTLPTEELEKNINGSDQNQDKRTEEVSIDLDPSFCSEKLEKNVNESDFNQDKRTKEVSMDHDPSFYMNDALPTEELEKNVNGSDYNQHKRTEDVSMDNDPSFCMNDTLHNQELDKNAGGSDCSQVTRTEEVSIHYDPSFCMNDTLFTKELKKNVGGSDCSQDKRTEEIFVHYDLSFCMNDTLFTEELEKNVGGSDCSQDTRTKEVFMHHDPSFCMNDTLITEELEKNAGGSDCSQDTRTEEVSMHHDPSFCMNDTLFTEESKTNVNESVFKLSDGSGCEPKSSYSFTHVEHQEEEGFDVSRKCKHLLNEDVVTDSTESEEPTENLQYHTESEREMKPTYQETSLEPDFSAKISNNQISGDSSIKTTHDLAEESMSTIVADQMTSFCGNLLGSDKADGLRCKALPLEAVNVILHDNHAIKDDLQHEIKSPLPVENNEAEEEIEKSGNNRKEDPLVIKPPPNVDPYSDEWLAVFESAGEEILTMKSGAVQNSPQDKVDIELGPWSPVKRKTNEGIGPFDCTKYTHTQVPPPD